MSYLYYMSLIVDEMPWPLFKQQPHINKLPLQEQVKRYNAYLDQLSNLHYQNWYNSQPKGPAPKRIITSEFLQQEDLYYILQEDGSKIYITIE